MTTFEIAEAASLVDVESVLRRRGHQPINRGDVTRTLYPEERLTDILTTLGQFEWVKYFPSTPLRSYLDRFGRASFRKVARRLIRDRGEWVPVSDLASIAGDSTEDDLAFLERLQVLERAGDRVRLTRQIDNIGPSLEHYVAQLCIQELRGAADWGLTLQGLPRAGGDYDVLAWLEPSLVYVECKSARPSEVSAPEVRQFLQRGVELAPDLAILLIDTSDSVVNLVEATINPVLLQAMHTGDVVVWPVRAQADYPGVQFGFRRIYVTNTQPSILTQLRRCLQHYYAHVKGEDRWGKNVWHFVPSSKRDAT